LRLRFARAQAGVITDKRHQGNCADPDIHVRIHLDGTYDHAVEESRTAGGQYRPDQVIGMRVCLGAGCHSGFL
jgi:hypothetical protein